MELVEDGAGREPYSPFPREILLLQLPYSPFPRENILPQLPYSPFPREILLPQLQYSNAKHFSNLI
jgi:hypothetical protein